MKIVMNLIYNELLIEDVLDFHYRTNEVIIIIIIIIIIIVIIIIKWNRYVK